jgi:hypothetical protein
VFSLWVAIEESDDAANPARLPKAAGVRVPRTSCQFKFVPALAPLLHDVQMHHAIAGGLLQRLELVPWYADEDEKFPFLAGETSRDS